MKVKECMCNDVSCVKPEAKVCEVAKLMLDKHVGCIPVCDNNNKVVGLVTDRDLILRSLACNKDTNKTLISDVMTTKVYEISSEADISEASKMMAECQIRRIPVVDNNAIVGIISLGDLTQKCDKNQISSTVEGICKCGENAKNAE